MINATGRKEEFLYSNTDAINNYMYMHLNTYVHFSVLLLVLWPRQNHPYGLHPRERIEAFRTQPFRDTHPSLFSLLFLLCLCQAAAALCLKKSICTGLNCWVSPNLYSHEQTTGGRTQQVTERLVLNLCSVWDIFCGLNYIAIYFLSFFLSPSLPFSLLHTHPHTVKASIGKTRSRSGKRRVSWWGRCRKQSNLYQQLESSGCLISFCLLLLWPTLTHTINCVRQSGGNCLY